MDYGHFKDVIEEKVENAKYASIQWLIKKEDGAPNFALRRIVLKEGGCSPHHSHNYEHEIYILSGEGKAIIEEKEYALKEGSFLLIKPNLKHQIINTKENDLIFLCIIPI